MLIFQESGIPNLSTRILKTHKVKNLTLKKFY